jgi:hypothetical protein
MKKHRKSIKGVLSLIMAIALCLSLAVPALAFDMGYAYPDTGSNDSAVGSKNWSDTQDIDDDDNDGAYVDLSAGQTSRYLKGTDYDFSIPSGATITGITVEIRRDSESGGDRIRDNVVMLVKGGSVVGTGKAISGNWSTSTTTVSYGGQSDLWGTTWTPAEINSNNFGVALSVYNANSGSNREAWVDYLRVRVTYDYNHTITATAGAGGTISPTGSVSVADGDDRTFTITPSPGYIVSGVTTDTTSRGKVNTYTFDNVTSNHSISAAFDGGWKQPTAGNSTGMGGEDLTKGYTSNDSRVEFTHSNAKATYYGFGTLVPAGATVTGIQVSLEANDDNDRPFDVLLSYDGGSNWTDPKGSGDFSGGDSTAVVGGAGDLWGHGWTLAILNSDNFRVMLDPESDWPGDSTYLDQLQVKVSYTLGYTLTYSAGPGGSISGTSPQAVTAGGSGSAVMAVPSTGYHFTSWTDGSTVNPRTDTNVTSNISVTANFAINTYTLTYTAGANGTISGASPQQVNYNSSGTAVTAVPNAGYHFTSWSDGSTVNPRTDTNVMAAINVTATFAINTYTLTYTPGTGGTISGTTPQVVNHGSDGSPVTAVPNTDFHFVDWSDGVTANPRTDTNVTAIKTVVANFAANTYTLNATAPAFSSVIYSYTAIAPGDISIVSSGNSDATISSVTLTGDGADAFTLTSGDTTIVTGTTNTSWKITPKTGQNAGTYNVLITVTYNNGATTTTSTSLVVGRANPNIELGGLAVEYNGSQHPVTWTTTPGSLAGLVSIVYIGTGGDETPPTNAGSYPVVALLSTENYYGRVSTTIVISPADPGIDISNLSATYTGAPAPGATVTTAVSGLTVTLLYTGTSDNGNAYSDATPPTEAGAYSVTASVTDPNYAKSVSRSYTINPVPVTFTYGNLNPAFTGSPIPLTVTATATSPFSAPDVSSSAITILYDGSATAPTNAGSYTVTVAVTDKNYSGTGGTTYVIGQYSGATISISETSKVYTGSLCAPPSVETIPAGIPYIITYQDSTGLVDITVPVDAGSYKVTVTLTDANYTATSQQVPFTITKAPASITLTGATTQIYGSVVGLGAATIPDPLAYTIEYTGTSYLTSPSVPTDAGTYNVTATIIDNNYEGTVSGIFTIEKKTVTIGITEPAPLVYDGTERNVGVTISDSQTGAISYTGADTAGVAYGPTATAPINAGTYTATVTVNSANYTGTNTLTFTIARAALSVTADNNTSVYGSDPTLVLTASGSGLVTPDTLSSIGLSAQLTLSTTATSSSSVGDYDITVTGPAQTANYTVTYSTTPGTLSITPASSTVAVTAANATYDGDTHGATATVTGAGGLSQALSVTYTGTTAGGADYNDTSAPTEAGSYTATATYTGDTNHTGSTGTANFTIAKKAASVMPTAAGKIYGDLDPASFSGTLNGFLTIDEVNATYSRTPGETVNVYAISAVLSPTEALSNYDITYNTASFTIDRKNASVSPSTSGKTVGGLDPTLTGTLTGFLASDNVIATYDRVDGEDVGIYPISAVLSPTGVLNNYNIAYNTALFTISEPYYVPTDNTGGGGGNTATASSKAIVTITIDEAGRTIVTATIEDASSGTLDSETIQAILEAVNGVEEDDGATRIVVTLPDAASPQTVTLTNDQMEQFAATNAGLEIGGGIGWVRFDAAAVESITEQSGASSTTFTIKAVDKSTLSAANQEAVGDRPVYDVTVTAGSTTISDLGDGTATIALPFTPDMVDSDTGSIVIYYMSASGPVLVEDCVYNEETGMVIFTVEHLSAYGAGYKTSAYTDGGSWYDIYVNYLTVRGIINPETFSPNKEITRAEFVVILAEIADADLSAYTAQSFSDVAATASYFGAVEWANDNGIVKGYDGMFSPNNTITRQDIATILLRYADAVTLALPELTDGLTFTDGTTIADYASDAVAAMQQALVLNGYLDGSFKPTANMTQAEVMKVFAVFMQLLIEW